MPYLEATTISLPSVMAATFRMALCSVVLNKAVIGKNCLIGANALVTEKMNVPDGSLVLGSPGKVIKPLGAGALAMLSAIAQSYVDKIDVYTSGLRVAE